MLYLLFLFTTLFYLPKNIFAVVDPLKSPNNKFGIHILYPEELSLAAKLVNSSGGDWGYVTIPIQSTDKNLEKWQKFMDTAEELHLIPILRIATYPVSDYWPKPDLYDAIDFANFLDSLDWPTKNRYVILYNEPNRAAEWGGNVDPVDYANFLNSAIDIYKKRNDDFFILNAGLDAAAPSNHVLMDSFEYIRMMEEAVPGIFNKLDGWNSHSYPNPDFSSTPYENRKNTIYGYRWEKEYLYDLGVKDLPVFITETGWRLDVPNIEKTCGYYVEAFSNCWSDKNIVAITPFLLTAGAGPFTKFSFTTGGGEPLENFKKISSIPKIAGKPKSPQGFKEISSNSVKLQKMNKNTTEQPIWSEISTNIWKEVLKWFFYK